MSRSTDVTRHDSELQQLAERAQNTINTANAEGRDLTAAEVVELRSTRHRMEALRETIETAEVADQISQRVAVLDAAMNTRGSGRFMPTLLVGEDNLRSHWRAIVEGGTHSAVEEVEERARVTAQSDMGSAASWADGAPNQPRHLIEFAGVPVSPLTGLTAQVPVFTGPVGAVGAAEGTNHGEYDTVDRADLAALRYGRWSDVSSVVAELDDLRGLNQMHSWGIARDLDKVAVTALATAAGTPATAGSDLERTVRQTLLTVAASTFAGEEQLVIVGRPSELARLTGVTPANGSDIGSYATRFAGARLYPCLESGAGVITAFAPNAFRVFMSPLRSATTIDPANGAQRFGSWLHSTPVAPQIAGAAAAVMTAGS